MKKYHVTIPDESYSIIEFKQEELIGIAVVNAALKGFEPKEVFQWHLSIMIDFEDVIENGMPSLREREIINKFDDSLNTIIKGEDKDKPNALF